MISRKVLKFWKANSGAVPTHPSILMWTIKNICMSILRFYGSQIAKSMISCLESSYLHLQLPVSFVAHVLHNWSAAECCAQTCDRLNWTKNRNKNKSNLAFLWLTLPPCSQKKPDTLLAQITQEPSLGTKILLFIVAPIMFQPESAFMPKTFFN